MAAPSYATDLTDITTGFTETDWGLITEGGGGQNAITAPDTDDFIQGTNAVSRNPFSSSIRGLIYDRATITVAADDAVYHWWKADVAQALETFAAGGVHLVHGISATAYKKFYVAGSDTYELGGWRCTPIDPEAASDLDRGTPGTPDYDTFGIAFDVPSTGPTKGYPFKHDMIRHGRSVDVIGGEVADEATWDKLTTYNDDITRRWGIAQGTDTGAAVQGIVNWGTSGDAVYSRDTGRSIVFNDTLGFVITSFTQILFDNASSDIEWTGMTFTALGTLNRGLFLVDPNDPAIILTSCVFNDTDTFGAEANTDLIACTFNNTNEVIVKGGSIVGSRFLTPTVAADSYAVLYNEAADPDGEFDNTEFTQGTASHHAIEFGTTAPTTMTLRGIDFTGFSGTSTAAALNFLRTTGSTTVNLIGCSGTITAQVTGSHTVTFEIDPVTTAVHVQNINTGADLVGARVYLLATTVGPLPWEVTVAIDRTGSTAEVLHTGHGLATNQWVKIEGADQEEYNGAKEITRVDDDNYTYAVTGTPTAPATGTIEATAIIVFGVTDSNGDITDQRSYASDQGFDGWVRKSSDPYYKTSPLSGIIDSADGLPITVGMIPD